MEKLMLNGELYRPRDLEVKRKWLQGLVDLARVGIYSAFGVFESLSSKYEIYSVFRSESLERRHCPEIYDMISDCNCVEDELNRFGRAK